MRITLRWLGAGMAAACVAFAVGPAAAAEQSPALKAVVAAAQKEGKLELQWGLNANGNAAQVKQMGDAMNAMFGTTIAVRYTPGPSEPEMVNKVVVTLAANLPSPTDVVINSNQLAAEMYRQKASMPVDWVALLPDRIQPESVEADGAVIRVYTTVPGGIVYNTQRAPEKPAMLTDLLKPEWKGKIASTPYATGWELLTASDVWGMDRALDFARKLSPQLAGVIRCSDLERVASGEFVAFAMNCGGRDWLTAQRNGAPIDYVVAKDFAAERYYYAAVPKNAANPNAAKLFVTFLETPEGQKLLWDGTLNDLNTYPDSQFARVIADYEKGGVKFQQFTVAWYLQHPEAQEGSLKAQAILNGH